jgi:DNA-binding Xre family transcriptional regulator
MNNNLRKIRIFRGIKSPKKFAGLIETSPQNLFYMETKGQTITSERAQKICKILDCTLDELYDENLNLSDLNKTKEKNNTVDVKFFNNFLNKKFIEKENFKSFINDCKNYEIHNYSGKMFEKMNRLVSNEKGLISFIMGSNYMCNHIINGNLIVVDTGNIVFTDNQVYLVNENSELKIRRIKQPDPYIDKYQITSDKEDDIDFKQYFKRLQDLKDIIYGSVLIIIR